MATVIFSNDTTGNYKLRATFYYNNEKIKTYQFGDNRYEDYTIHNDDKRKANYISRHKKRENWNKINKGSLSRWILWNKKTKKASISDFKKRFHLF